MYTIIVTGSRDHTATWQVGDMLSQLSRGHNYEIFVKVGDCPTGIDKQTHAWCETVIPDNYTIFVADWKKYGKRAGPIRNHAMVDSGAALVVAYPGEESKGTKDCAEYAASKGIPVWFPTLPSWAQWATPIAQFRH